MLTAILHFTLYTLHSLSGLWTAFLLSLACASTIAWLVALMHEKNVRPVQDLVAFFKKQSKAGRVILGTFFIAMWIFASVKPGAGDGNGGGDGGGGNGGTNNVQMVVGPGSGLQPLDSTGAVTNDQQQGLQGGLQPPQGGLVGASFAGNSWTTNSLPTNVTSMAFWPLADEDAYNPDSDGDGLPTIDELFVYHTDPHNPDTDYDGLTDYEELFVHGTDPLNPYSVSDVYSDGFALKIGGENPFAYPEGSTNTVLEHVFYSGTTNGAFAYPQSSDDMAVLRVSVSGSGTGDLVVGGQVVPLVAQPPLRGDPPPARPAPRPHRERRNVQALSPRQS